LRGKTRFGSPSVPETAKEEIAVKRKKAKKSSKKKK
jgi:hypothetical protein